MATAYAYGKNDVWVDTGLTGPCDIQAQDGGDSLLHFGGITLPATYDAGPHFHLGPLDGIYKYRGTENIYVRSANNNISGISQSSKIALTPTV